MFVVVLNSKNWSQDWSFAQLCYEKVILWHTIFFISKLNSPKIFFVLYIKIAIILMVIPTWNFQGQKLSYSGENSEKFRKSMTSSIRDLPVRKPYSRSFGTKVGLIIRVHDGVLKPISISWLFNATRWSDHHVIFQNLATRICWSSKIVDFQP